MARAQGSLGELELEVLKVVWEREPVPFQEVAAVLGERRGSARTTVLTVLQRLCAKGFLRRRKRGGVFRYWAARERGKVMSGLIGRFVENVLDGSPAPFVAYLSQAKELGPEEVEALRKIAERVREAKAEDEG